MYEVKERLKFFMLSTSEKVGEYK